jgi:hypothetical protein
MDATAKQQIVERVRQANNILVTVSANPSIDQLAACIGLTLLLNRMNKHATAVFSGAIPSVVEFLQPEKTIETNTDSLRDFIISLDKAKADKLRYKVEDQFVRIFITPYRTSLGEKDLIFGQGDFNVEVVMALGVKDRAHIDAAIAAHGRILHDATVVTVNAGQGTTDVGQINWQEPTASSLSEMLVSISEAFGTGLIDGQMATAFLTGIVAETQRFSNNKTSPKVMTMAAQLMAAGANQQLIATKLEPSKPATPVPPKPVPLPPAPPKPTPPPPIGVLNVPHGPVGEEKNEVSVDPNEIHIDEQGNLKTAGDLLAEQERKEEDDKREEQPPPPPSLPTDSPFIPEESKKGNTLEESVPDPHAFMDSKPTTEQAFAATTEPEGPDLYNTVPIDPLSEPQPSGLTDHLAVIQPPGEGQSSSDSPTGPDADNARSAVESALDSAPFDPAFAPPVESLNAEPAMDLHSEPEDAPNKMDNGRNGDTPSLKLPTNGHPEAPSPADESQTDPPPMPPPLMPFGAPPK